MCSSLHTGAVFLFFPSALFLVYLPSIHMQLIPIEFFEAEDMNGHFVPIVPGGGHNRLTFHNRQEYVEKAIHFRLHELDQQASGTLVTYWWFRIHVCLPYTIAGGCCQGRHVIHCTCSTALSLHCSDVGSHCVWERAGGYTGPQEGGEVLFLHACVYACTYIVQRYSHFIYSILTKVS